MGVIELTGDLTFRPFSPGDEVPYLQLYNYVHPVSMSEEYWRWRNLTNPAGMSLIETAWDGPKLVGFYGLAPVRLSLRGKEILGGFSEAAVTHPDYRYRGIFSALGKSLYRRAAQSGIGIVYGFPTEHSRHGFLSALGWGEVRQHRDLWHWGQVGGGHVEGKYGEIRLIEGAGEEFDRVWRGVSQGLFGSNLLVVRDSRFIDWRFFRCPDQRYRVFLARGENGPEGYLAARLLEETGEKLVEISDLAAADLNCLRRLLLFSLEHFSEAGGAVIRLPAGGVQHSFVSRLGFREGGSCYYFGWRPTGELPGPAPEWHYTVADAGVI